MYWSLLNVTENYLGLCTYFNMFGNNKYISTFYRKKKKCEEKFLKKNQLIYLPLIFVPLIFSYIAIGMHIISKNDLIIFFIGLSPNNSLYASKNATYHSVYSRHAMRVHSFSNLTFLPLFCPPSSTLHRLLFLTHLNLPILPSWPHLLFYVTTLAIIHGMHIFHSSS